MPRTVSRRRAALVGVVILAAATLAACSGDDSNDASPTSGVPISLEPPFVPDPTVPPIPRELPFGMVFAEPTDAATEMRAIADGADSATPFLLHIAFETEFAERLANDECESSAALQTLLDEMDDGGYRTLAFVPFGCDDAVGGVRYTIMLADVDGSWTVEAATVEQLCLRGVDGTLCV